MSFKRRVIEVQFSDGASILKLQGLRCTMVIQNYGGAGSPADMVQLRAYGMTLEQMNQYSTASARLVKVGNVGVAISVGNQGEPVSQIFNGSVVAAWIDTAAIPDMSFVISAQTGYNFKGLPAASNQYAGAQNAEDIIASLAKSIGFKFENPKGAHVVLQNQYTSGSVIDQIQIICRAAALPLSLSKNTVTIWPNDGTRDDIVIDVSADLGMVGYPTYWDAGFIVKTLYNPDMQIGRSVNLKSAIPKANGVFPIISVTHELATMQQDGPWFTTAKLAPPPYVSAN